MRGTYPLSRVKLHRVLLELLKHPEVKLRYTNMVTQQGHSLWNPIGPPTDILIRVNANRNPVHHITTVVHELIHVVLYTMFIGLVEEDLEEVMVLALEADIYAYINKSKTRLARWNSIIAEKLADQKPEEGAPQ